MEDDAERVPEVVELADLDSDGVTEGVADTVTDGVLETVLDIVGVDVGDLDSLGDPVGVPEADFEGTADSDALLDIVTFGDVDEIAETDGEAVPLGVPEVDLVDVDVTETDDVLDGVIERVDCAEKVGDLVDVTL